MEFITNSIILLTFFGFIYFFALVNGSFILAALSEYEERTIIRNYFNPKWLVYVVFLFLFTILLKMAYPGFCAFMFQQFKVGIGIFCLFTFLQVGFQSLKFFKIIDYKNDFAFWTSAIIALFTTLSLGAVLATSFKHNPKLNLVDSALNFAYLKNSWAWIGAVGLGGIFSALAAFKYLTFSLQRHYQSRFNVNILVGCVIAFLSYLLLYGVALSNNHESIFIDYFNNQFSVLMLAFSFLLAGIILVALTAQKFQLGNILAALIFLLLICAIVPLKFPVFFKFKAFQFNVIENSVSNASIYGIGLAVLILFFLLCPIFLQYLRQHKFFNNRYYIQ